MNVDITSVTDATIAIENARISADRRIESVIASVSVMDRAQHKDIVEEHAGVRLCWSRSPGFGGTRDRVTTPQQACAVYAYVVERAAEIERECTNIIVAARATYRDSGIEAWGRPPANLREIAEEQAARNYPALRRWLADRGMKL